jgi:hypothetical protein
MLRPCFTLFATLSMLTTVSGTSYAQRLVTPLGEKLEPFVSDFNGGSSVPRLVVILSPT